MAERDYADLATYHNPSEPLPRWLKDIRPTQATAIEETMDAYEAGADVVFLDAPVGCLHGDTELIVNRAGKGFRCSIRDFVHKFNGGNISTGRFRRWDPSIPSEIAYSDGTHIRKALVWRAFESGVKECWKLRTEEGREIIGSAEHPLFERDGGWTELLHLEAGMKVAVRLDRRGGATRPKRVEKYRSNLMHHPHAASRGVADKHCAYRVPLHRLAYEADHLNGIELTDFISRCRTGEGLDGLRFLDPYLHVHHIDHNYKNNDSSNLAALTPAAHREHHADERSVLFRQGWETVESIEPVGEHETYDLTMVDAPHSYIANGFVVHNSGKTIVAELVRRARGGRGVYTCSDKALQRQFSRDFPYAAMLMGKANYPTEHGPTAITAEDCTSMVPGDACNWCEHRSSCPYSIAKFAAIAAPLAVLNVSYLLASANYAGAFNKEGFTIVDEADTLENALLGFVEYKVPQWVKRSLSVGVPKKGSHKATLVKSLGEMQQAAATELKRMIGRNAEPKAIRQMQSFGVSTSVMQMALAKDIAAGDDDEESGHWLRVYDDGDDTFHMKPVLVGSFGTQALWRHAKQWLLMSGTLISVDEMVDTLGLPLDHATVTVPMSFPVENRPIIIAPIADMSYKAGEHEYEQMAWAIHRVLVNHPGERVLIHTVSRARAERLMATLRSNDWTEGRRLIDYRSARERDQALDRYKKTEGAVMFAQSMVRGIDLPGDLCRVQVVAKVPFASLGDKRVSARLHLPGGDSWYKVQAIRDVVQMTGRGVRNEDDHATTYIFDKQFSGNLWHPNTRRMFPQYWRDAVDKSRDIREFILGAQVAAR